METKIDLIRSCSDCKGAGKHHHDAWTSVTGTSYPAYDSECTVCGGTGTMAAPDFDALFLAVTTDRGVKVKGKRKFRKSPPQLWAKSTQGVENRRAYYVWRLARFHGGADVTLPMTADLFCGRDAYRKELDAYAELLARAAFGTDMAAAHRWSRAMGYSNAPVPEGQPATAYSGGPVHDGNKPAFERLELK